MVSPDDLEALEPVPVTLVIISLPSYTPPDVSY